MWRRSGSGSGVGSARGRRLGSGRAPAARRPRRCRRRPCPAWSCRLRGLDRRRERLGRDRDLRAPPGGLELHRAAYKRALPGDGGLGLHPGDAHLTERGQPSGEGLRVADLRPEFGRGLHEGALRTGLGHDKRRFRHPARRLLPRRRSCNALPRRRSRESPHASHEARTAWRHGAIGCKWPPAVARPAADRRGWTAARPGGWRSMRDGTLGCGRRRAAAGAGLQRVRRSAGAWPPAGCAGATPACTPSATPRCAARATGSPRSSRAATGPRLSHRAAAAHLGPSAVARAAASRSPHAARPRSPPGIDLHETARLGAGEVTVRAGIPVTTVSRTLADLAAVLGHRDLERTLERAEALQVLDVPSVLASVAYRAGARRGPRDPRCLGTGRDAQRARGRAPAARRERRAPAARGERAGRRVRGRSPVARRAGSSPRPTASRFHLTRAAMERDRRRDAVLARAGYRVLRFTDRQVRAAQARSRRDSRRPPRDRLQIAPGGGAICSRSAVAPPARPYANGFATMQKIANRISRLDRAPTMPTGLARAVVLLAQGAAGVEVAPASAASCFSRGVKNAPPSPSRTIRITNGIVTQVSLKRSRSDAR